MLSLHPNKGSRLSKKLDSILWWILRLFPLLVIFAFVWGNFNSESVWSYAVTDADSAAPFYFLYDYQLFLEEFFSLSSDNTIFTSLLSIFGAEGILPFFNDYRTGFFLFYIQYLVLIELLHLFFDVIVFIPRLAHKWISNAVQDD